MDYLNTLYIFPAGVLVLALVLIRGALKDLGIL